MDDKYKDYRDKWDAYPKQDIVTDFPLHLDIETQTMCNIRCSMCYQSFDPVKPAVMSEVIYRKILDEATEYELCACKLQLRNEPLLDKRLPSWIRMAKQAGILDMMINTNATMLTEQLTKQIIEAGLDTILFSVNGTNKQVYESIMKGADYDKTVKNIKFFSDYKREFNLDKPRIIIRTIKHPNIDFDEYVRQWYDYADAVLEFRCMDLKPPEDLNTYPGFCCEELWHRLSILADGTIVPCCNAAVGNTVYEPLGNIRKISIHEAWMKAEYLRELHRKGQSHRLLMCRKCDINKEKT